MILRKKPKLRMNVRPSNIIRCPQHLVFVRNHECCIKDRQTPLGTAVHICDGRIEAMHVRTGTDGGTGLKPGDNWTIPGCSGAHRHQHDIGEPRFEACWHIDMKAIAAALWKASPAKVRYEAKLRDAKG